MTGHRTGGRGFAVAVTLAVIAGLGVPQRTAAAERTTYEAVGAGLAAGRIVLIDVREPEEFRTGHVPGAVNMPLSAFKPAAVPAPGDKTVVVMCRSGARSARAISALATIGRTDVVDYSGSLNDWTAHGGALVGEP
ncbi:rhodanese-like domain-containing protein [Siculibacillus lacustris]|uniref:Rhodanese-like domain-containing protein n=1 Tax=Siculibacillus lacustris TaxID=1549641 RepID=A0A4Q9VQM0_9HYPH|nr:rhodanese-like domain-containing protein [Siculibacillus lacustris]TBW37603.1 rhodanese-like domain-containing protein [Siculibacillus lacustris]